MYEGMQQEVRDWGAYNFPGQPPHIPLLGAVEELGELAHAHIKQEQGIRTGEDHDFGRVDALGDIIIYLMHYCAHYDIDLMQVVTETWMSVRERDWQRYPKNGLNE